jgi:hypothetical protein
MQYYCFSTATISRDRPSLLRYKFIDCLVHSILKIDHNNNHHYPTSLLSKSDDAFGNTPVMVSHSDENEERVALTSADTQRLTLIILMWRIG